MYIKCIYVCVHGRKVLYKQRCHEVPVSQKYIQESTLHAVYSTIEYRVYQIYM